MTFRVIYEREPDGWWVASVPEVQGCHTQGRTISQARRRLKEALAVSTSARTSNAAKFAEEFVLPRGVMRDLDTLREMKKRVTQTRREMSKIERRVLKSLRDEVQLGQRDAGELLGVSFQRVHQLEAGD